MRKHVCSNLTENTALTIKTKKINQTKPLNVKKRENKKLRSKKSGSCKKLRKFCVNKTMTFLFILVKNNKPKIKSMKKKDQEGAKGVVLWNLSNDHRLVKQLTLHK